MDNVLTVQDQRAIHGGWLDVTNTYDDRYRNTSTTNGETTHFRYDGNDNLETVIEPQSADFEKKVWIQRRLPNKLRLRRAEHTLIFVDESRVDPRKDLATGGVTRYLYDANRNKIAQQDANGNLTTYAFDGLIRMTALYQSYVAGPLDESFITG